MARIVKLDNGKYKAIVEAGKNPSTGRRKRKIKTFERKKDAQNWLANMVKTINEKTYVDTSSLTLGELLDRWLENDKRPKIAATTYDRYKIIIVTHLKPALGAIPIQELEPYHIEVYFAQKRKSGKRDETRGLSENSLKNHYFILNAVIKQAIKLKLLMYNPVQAVDPPRSEKKEAPVMSREEYNKLLDVLKDDLFMFTVVITDLMTGMRRSELLGLEWSEVDLKKGVIEVKKRLVAVSGGVLHEEKTKTESSKRKIKISDKLVVILKKFKKEQVRYRLLLGADYNDSKDFVFSRPDGKNYAPRTINLKFNKYLDKAGLSQKYTIHTLRHTFATINLQNKIPLKIVQKMLGHSTIVTTANIYSHVDIDMQQEAVDKLNKSITLK